MLFVDVWTGILCTIFSELGISLKLVMLMKMCLNKTSSEVLACRHIFVS
jgi:hypothetical protein